MEDGNDERRIGVTEAARLSGYSTRTVRLLITEGVIEASMPRGKWLILRSSFLEYVGRRPKPDGPEEKQ